MLDTPDSHDLRYSRHLALPEFGTEGQTRVAAARVLLVGLGGLGSPAAMYLAAAGIGTLLLNDFDSVDLSNLQRQLLHRNVDVGRAKTESAAETIAAINPECQVERLAQRLSDAELQTVIASADVVLDGSDNFGTRFAVNAACVRVGIPLVSGAAIRFEGQLTTFIPDDPASPCYACLYQEADEELENCRSNGVLAPLTGVIGSMMAVEALKLITGIGDTLAGRLLQYDARHATIRTTYLKRDPACPVCSKR
ncbi:MAG TPA: molybdopterin-synthase adenylyltransferase MoeB [Gammaproteobacteria bacterium]|nr:molybdopterin-synthase adenylyltransferase MoeB [Gammaproteobacteria bacterium]